MMLLERIGHAITPFPSKFFSVTMYLLLNVREPKRTGELRIYAHLLLLYEPSLGMFSINHSLLDNCTSFVVVGNESPHC